jgi:hypothetical protein
MFLIRLNDNLDDGKHDINGSTNVANEWQEATF